MFSESDCKIRLFSVVRTLPSSKVKKINSPSHVCLSSDRHRNLEKVSTVKLKGLGSESSEQGSANTLKGEQFEGKLISGLNSEPSEGNN